MKQNSLEIWRQRVADKESSNLKLNEWCDKNNITRCAFYYWSKRVKADSQKFGASTPVFAEVKIRENSPIKNSNSNLQITWQDINISISDSETAKLAAVFLSQLQSLC